MVIALVEDSMNQIRFRLKEEIEKSGKSQSEIARQINVKQQTVNDYVRMKSFPAPDTLAKLCIYLDLDANYILGITDFYGKK